MKAIRALNMTTMFTIDFTSATKAANYFGLTLIKVSKVLNKVHKTAKINGNVLVFEYITNGNITKTLPIKELQIGKKRLRYKTLPIDTTNGNVSGNFDDFTKFSLDLPIENGNVFGNNSLDELVNKYSAMLYDLGTADIDNNNEFLNFDINKVGSYDF